jgi:hypothetical protein
MPESASPMQPGATIIEIRPFRGGWQCFEGPGVQPSWTGEHAEEDAIAPIATLTGSPRYIFEFQNLRRNTEPDGGLRAVVKRTRIDRRSLSSAFRRT